MRTDGRAEIDKTNYVRILGREKDLVISGGLNVYPQDSKAYFRGERTSEKRDGKASQSTPSRRSLRHLPPIISQQT